MGGGGRGGGEGEGTDDTSQQCQKCSAQLCLRVLSQQWHQDIHQNRKLIGCYYVAAYLGVANTSSL